jgi:hypothetical protein
MATESSEPRTGLILRMGGLALVTLFIVHAGLGAYFDRMARAEVQRKQVAPEALMSLRADEKARLAAGAMPIDKAMQMLTEKGRMGAGAAITPTTSRDVAPLQGWAKMPGEVPEAMMAPPPSSAPPAVDGGAMATDGGAPAANRPDAGPSAPLRGTARPPHK